MKKFFTKVSLLLLILISFFLILNFAYKRTNYWKSENDIYKFRNIPDNIELAAIGSSHVSMHFKFDVVPEINAFNFGVKGELYNYDYKMLKQFSPHFKKNALVILMIEYPEILQRNGNDDFSIASYYRLLDKQNIDDYSFKNYIVFKVFPILSAKRNIWKIFDDIKENEMYILTHPKMAKPSLPGDEVVKYRAEWRYNSWRQAQDEEKGFEENFADISKMIDFCLEHEFRPVLVATPLMKTLTDHFDKDETFMNYYNRFTDGLLKKYPGLQFFNYSHDEEFQSNLLLFGDAVEHLNTTGAEKFTRKVVEDFKKNGLL